MRGRSGRPQGSVAYSNGSCCRGYPVLGAQTYVIPDHASGGLIYPLNGPDGDYKTPTGVPGKCKAQLKDKYLVLESVVVTPTQPNGPSMRMHIKERWQLSKDSKILTIKTEIDFPDAPPMVSSIVGEYGSGTEKYIRTEGR